MGALADRLRSLEPRPSGVQCRLCSILAELDPDDAQAVRDTLAKPKGDPSRLSGQQIADELTAAGYRVTEHVVSNHRRTGHG